MRPLTFVLLALCVCLTFSQLNTNYWNFIAKYDWRLIQINGRLLQDSKIRAFLRFDIDRMSFSGNAGCNRIFGSFSSSASSIGFSLTGTTRMACFGEAGALESEFLSLIKERGLTFDVADQVLNIYFGDKLVLMFGLSTKHASEVSFEDNQEKSDVWNFIARYNWNLIQLNGVTLSQSKAFIRFDTTKMKVSGSGGCNRFFGGYSVTGNKIAFASLGMTKMMCQGEAGQIENEFVQTLQKEGLSYDVAEQALNIYLNDKIVLMFGLSKPAPSTSVLLNSTSNSLDFLRKYDWNLIQLNGATLSEGKISMKFDVLNMRVSGSGGCNQYFGQFSIDGNKISFLSIGMTRMMCQGEVGKNENEFIQTLGKAGLTFDIAEQTLNLYLNDKIVLMFGLSTPASSSETVLEFNADSIWSFIGKHDWSLIQLNGVTLSASKASIKFDVTTKRVSGSGGCNRFFGGYSANGNKISFTSLGMTKMMCQGELGRKENEFIQTLRKDSLTFDVAEQTLNFYHNGKIVLMFGLSSPAANPTATLASDTDSTLKFLGKHSWNLIQLNGLTLTQSKASIAFYVAKMRVSGSGGCNRFFGGFSVDGNKIAFSALGMTKMMCEGEVGRNENAYIETLAKEGLTFDIAEQTLNIYFNGKIALMFGLSNPSSGAGVLIENTNLWNFIGKQSWGLIQINGQTLTQSQAFIKFDTVNKRVSGKGGCNRFFGSYSSESNKISFSSLGTTRMFCGEELGKLESAFVSILGQSGLTFDVAEQTLNLYLNDTLVLMFGIQGGNQYLQALGSGKWSLAEINGRKLVQPSSAFIQFDVAKMRVNGNSGCNSYFGSFSSAEEGKISFSSMGMTRMACFGSAGELETEIMKVLSLSNLSFNASGGTLTLTNEGQPVLIFTTETVPSAVPSIDAAATLPNVEAQDKLELLGKFEWKLLEVDSRKIVSARASMFLNFSSLQVYGSGGCNRYFGSFSVSGNAITFTNIASTLMYCYGEPSEVEGLFLKNLNKALTFEVDGNSLKLFSLGVPVLIFGNPQEQTIYGKKWELSSINGVQAQEAKATLRFQEKDMLIAGNTGCNSFSGKFTLSRSRIQISPLAMTEMACAGARGEMENSFLKAIASSDLSIELTETGLNFLSGGEVIMSFRPQN